MSADQQSTSDLICYLNSKLQNYKHLDDYDHYQESRSKYHATKKFILIMRSIRDDINCKQSDILDYMAKDKFDSRFSNEDVGDETDISDNRETKKHVNDFSDFNQILKRHRKRFKLKKFSRHHR